MDEITETEKTDEDQSLIEEIQEKRVVTVAELEEKSLAETTDTDSQRDSQNQSIENEDAQYLPSVNAKESSIIGTYLLLGTRECLSLKLN